jgi:hypothetical protein
MREVSDAFLLNMAEVSASLIGLFLVGVFFYVETGFRRSGHAREVFEPYLRSGTRITLVVFAIPIGLSLALVTMEILWARLLFAMLSVLLLVVNVDSIVHVRGVTRAMRSKSLLVNEIVTTAVTIVMLVIPWALGGWHPGRKELAWAIVLAFAAGFLSIGATVMSAFDVARLELASPIDGRETASDKDDGTDAGHKTIPDPASAVRGVAGSDEEIGP